MAQTGNYSELLLMFDSVLAKGFDGQHFLGGLAEHLRNLLVAKNPQTISLLELSGSVAQAYTTQATGLSVEFLFSAINLVNTADAAYRNATSRRLHIELTLMKLAGIATPINPIPTPKLPKIDANQTATTPNDTVSNTANVTPTPPPTPAPTAQQPTAPEPEPPTQTTPPVPTNGSMLGISLNQNQQQNNTQNTTTTKEEEKKKTDPTEGLKNLTKNFHKLAELWENNQKPRIAMALRTAQISQNNINITVPNEIMQTEIENSQVELDTNMMTLFGYRLPLSFTITEEIVIERPITIQQKLEHLVAKNPTILKLKEALDLSL